MKKEKGITLVSLVVYIIVMVIIIAAMTTIIANFYQNTEAVQGNVQEIVEFNKFNSYFLKEVKTKNNKVDRVDLNYILFSSGNSFSISNNGIYYNNIKICDNVQNIEFILEQDTEDTGEEYSIISVTLDFENFNKSIKYKIENIY